MRLESSEYPEFVDYEWFALDEDGYIAAFTTAGIGPIPKAVLVSHVAEDALDEFIARLPTRGAATMLVSLPRPDDYVAFAKRGLFAYDWDDVHRPFSERREVYGIVSRPASPIH